MLVRSDRPALNAVQRVSRTRGRCEAERRRNWVHGGLLLGGNKAYVFFFFFLLAYEMRVIPLASFSSSQVFVAAAAAAFDHVHFYLPESAAALQSA